MTLRIPALFCALLMLQGCSALSLIGMGDEPASFPGEAATTPVAVAAAVTPDQSWCTQIAGNQQRQAKEAGFDLPTQQKMTVTAFKQCMATAAP